MRARDVINVRGWSRPYNVEELVYGFNFEIPI